MNQQQQQIDVASTNEHKSIKSSIDLSQPIKTQSKTSSKKLKTKSAMTITPPSITNSSTQSFNSSPSSASSSSSSSSYQSYMNNYQFNSEQDYTPNTASMLAQPNGMDNNNGYSIQNILNFAAQQYVAATNPQTQSYSNTNALLKRKQQQFTQNSTSASSSNSSWVGSTPTSTSTSNPTNTSDELNSAESLKDTRRSIESDSNS